MKKSNPYRRRLIVVLSFLAAVLVFFGVMLFNYQIVNGDEYRALSVAGTAKREVVETSRGIITDRNGKVLVSNRLAYTLKFSDSDFGKDQAACNDAVWRLIELCQAEGVEWIDPLPLTAEVPYTLSTETPGETFINWLKSSKLAYTGESTVTLTASSDEVMAALRKVYAIADGYTDQQARLIAGVRYGAKISGGYVFAEDVPVRVISQVVDGHYAGVSTGTSSQRVYNTTYAAHILGRVSRIFAEDWDNYKDKGYSMDALVGKGGVEEAFESYLHGTNGVKLVTTDKNGKVTGELYAKEPQPGNTVALTIDLDLQKVTEDSLAEKIGSMEKRDGLTRGGACQRGHRRGAGAGLLPHLRPQPVGRDVRHLEQGHRGAPHVQPRHRRHLRPRLYLQALLRRGGAGVRHRDPLHHHRGPRHLHLLHLPPAQVLDL